MYTEYSTVAFRYLYRGTKTGQLLRTSPGRPRGARPDMFLSHRSSCLRLTDQLSQRDVFLGDLGELDFHALRGVVTSIRAGRSDKPRATSTLRATAQPAWICSLSFASHGSVRSGPSAAVLQLLGGPVQ